MNITTGAARVAGQADQMAEEVYRLVAERIMRRFPHSKRLREAAADLIARRMREVPPEGLLWEAGSSLGVKVEWFDQVIEQALRDVR